MKKLTGLFAFLVAVTMVFAMTPQMTDPAYAAEGDPAMVLGTDVLQTNAGMDDPQLLCYFGKDWHVIAYEGKDGDDNQIRYQNREGAYEDLYPSDAVTLLCAPYNSYENAAWGSRAEGLLNVYSTSLLRSYIDDDFDSWLLGPAEQKSAVLSRTLPGGGDFKWEPESNFDANRVMGDAVDNAFFWPLSEAEAEQLPQSILNSQTHWWLRTPGPIEDDESYDPNGLAAFVFMHVDDFGEPLTHEIDYGWVDGQGLLRPAFYLNEDAVLFTSSVLKSDDYPSGESDGKQSGELGPDAMMPIGTNSGNAWKVTLKDDGTITGLDGHKDFKVTSVSSSSDGLTVEYTGANTENDNEFISAIFKDLESGELLSYGRLQKVEAADGSVTINVPEDFSSCSYQLYVFNEQYNEDSSTDFASDLFFIDRPDAEHVWDSGTVTKEPTTTEEGVKTYTCTVCGKTRTEPIPKLEIKDKLIAKMTSKGKKTMIISWNEISGAEGYEVYFGRCTGKSAKLTMIKTVKAGEPLKIKKKKGLKKKRAYKAYVKAYAMKDGTKVYLGTSPRIHAYTSGGKGKFTNPKSVTVDQTEVSLTEGGTHQIKAKVKKLKKNKKLIADFHEVALRYLSCDDTVATVSDSGLITAKGKGSCKIYVFSVNGVKKIVTVTVQ